ncbi:MAG: penicillin-binding protein [Bacteroidaceae bacterium]|nr:penicillin-binding protein [Bacteroidaceae bacterium]
MKKYLRQPLVTLQTICTWYASQYRGKWYQRLLTPIATLFVLFFLYLGAVEANFLWLFGKSPTMAVIQNPVTNEASYLYAADNDSVPIGKFFNENRSPVEYKDISPYIIYALLSTEDERFYQHHGIDYAALFAALRDMTEGNARGASTITQQLVKNLFKMRSQYSTGLLGKIPLLKLLVMKSKEWITAIKIENLYSKEDILTLYLNTVDFGSNAYGIRTAAKTYFGANCEPSNLTAEQAAVLVGLLKATTTYNPKVNPEKSLQRRNVVLRNMLQHPQFAKGVEPLTQHTLDSLCHIPIDLTRFKVETAYEGKALYFREYVRQYLAAWCRAKGYDLYSDGLRIYTTLDLRLQAYAEWAVQKQMKSLQKKFEAHWRGMVPWRDERHQEVKNFIEDIARRTDRYKQLSAKYHGDTDSISYYMNQPHKVRLFAYGKGDSRNGYIEKEISTLDSIRYMVSFLHCGFVVMEPQTSMVKAWVGDIDFNHWKYDKVTAMRQPGSTFKLFVYASAFEHNDSITPEYRIPDSYVSIPVPDAHTGKTKMWTPHNANGYCTHINMPLRTAFAQSVNTVAVKLGQLTGVDNIVDIAHRMGVHSRLDPVPSLALGSSDVSLLELCDAYATVMNDGVQCDPIVVTRITDRDGTEIYNYKRDAPQPRQAIRYKTAYYMQRLLWGGMREHGGTTQALWQYVRPVVSDTEFGGKTGTSNNHSDAWFVGATPHLVGAAWVGGEYRCIHFRTGQLGQGSRTALPIFGYFAGKALQDPHFMRYRGKFPEAKEEIPKVNYYGPVYDPKPDTTHRDTVIGEAELGNAHIEETATPETAEEE